LKVLRSYLPLALLLPVTASASDWQEIQVDDFTRTAIDRQSVTTEDGLTRIWMRIYYYAGAPVPAFATIKQPQAAPIYSYVKLLVAFDCKRRSEGTLQSAYYATDDKLVGSWTADMPARETLHYVVPDSVGEHELTVVCRLILTPRAR
jgi:hypothetical protein